MNKIFTFFQDAAEEAGEWLEKATELFKGEDPIMILPYRGYANGSQLYVKGRVLEDESFFRRSSNDKLNALMASFKRFETDEIPFAEVSIKIAGQSYTVQADEEGYFTLDTAWDPPADLGTKDWIAADYELHWPQPIGEGSGQISTQGEILWPTAAASYGIISDIDDTILQTHVNSRLKLKMLYATFMQNAAQRLPMEGVVDLFQAFHKGKSGHGKNPIFYVSNSPWNLYDLLERFMDIHELPKGPIFLRDYGIRPSGPFSQHKLVTISRILDTYPDLPFIMLGDTASKDADFYLQLAAKYPGRIKAIYIRLTQDNSNARRVARLIEQQSEMTAILVQTSEEIIEHARGVGLL